MRTKKEEKGIPCGLYLEEHPETKFEASIPIQASCASGVKRWDDLPVNDASPTMLAALKMFTACKFEDKEELTTAHLFAQSAIAKAEREI